MFRFGRWLLLAALVFSASACGHDRDEAKQSAIERGDAYATEQKYGEAIIEFRKSIAEDASFGPARLKLAEVYEVTGNYPEALREYVRAADLMPESVVAQLKAGQMLLAARQYSEARARAEAILKVDPQSVDGLMLLANSLAGLKDFAGAVLQVEDAIEREPKRTLLYANLGLMQMASGQKDAAESTFKRAVEVAPQSAATHAGLANFYWSAGRLNEAEAEWKNALALRPTDPVLLQAMASFYMNAGRNEDARTYLKAYSQAAPEPGAQLTLADFYISIGDTSAAIPVLQPLSQGTTAFAVPATLRLAAIAYDAGDKARGHELVDGVRQRDPKNQLANLSNARFLLRESKNTEALAVANDVLSADPSSTAGLFIKGSALKALGEIDAAIAAFQDVLKVNPSLFSTQMLLADLYLSKGDGVAAAQYATTAIRMQPKSGVARLALARAQVLQYQFPAAEAELARLEQTNANSPELHRLYGELAWRKRDVKRARTEYTKALALEPNSTEALKGLIQTDLAEKRVADAVERIETVLRRGSTDADFHVLAGVTFVAANATDKAEASFKHALELNPSNLEGYGRLATLYLMLNRADEARAQYERMVTGKPEQAVIAHTMLGTILSAQKKSEEARKQYEQALELDPKAAVAANNLAWQYANADEANLDVALKLAQTAKSQLPGSWEVTDTLGWIYYKKELWSLAVATLTEGVRMSPSNPTLHYHLGLAHAKNGGKTEAKRSLQKAIQLDPSFSEADDAKRVLATL